MAGSRAHPEQTIPSLTSRGRKMTGGVESLIRDSNDEGRVGRRYGTRMKLMTTDPNVSLPSLTVPSREGQKRRLVLWGNGRLWPRMEHRGLGVALKGLVGGCRIQAPIEESEMPKGPNKDTPVDLVQVNYQVQIRAMVGGRFSMPRADYEKLLAQWESRPNRYDETELAHEVIDWSGMGFDHMNIEDMEVEEFEAVEK